MNRLSDTALDHLRRVADWPELPGGRYEVLELIGEGGMGRVYRARDRALERDVALKLLRPELGTAEAVAGIEREARVLARLEHPGIVPVHDVGQLADGRVYSLMKLVRGEGLAAAVKDMGLPGRLRLFLRICDAVAFAHANRVIHRDLKPGNVMVGAFGEVLVLDWGLAALQGSAAGAPGMGTPGFMAPEQARGEAVDPRADVFALGRILAELAAVPGEDPPRPLAAIATRASAQSVNQRYAGVSELAAEVTRYLDGEPVLAYREPLHERLGRWYGRYQTAIVLILTYLTLRLLFLALRGV